MKDQRRGLSMEGAVNHPSDRKQSVFYPVRISGVFGDMEIGYLDSQGRIKFKIVAEDACGHYDQAAAVTRQGKVEIIHEMGKASFRSCADYAVGPFFEHFIGWVKSSNEDDDNWRGLLTKTGKWRIKPAYHAISHWDGKYFSGSRAMFEPYDLYRASGRIVLAEYGFVGEPVSEGLIAGGLLKDKKGRQGFRRLDGAWQIKPRFDSTTQFVNGRAFVIEGQGAKRKAGIVDRDGAWLRVLPKKVIGFAPEISEGVVGVYMGKTCGLMDLNGDLLCEGEWNLADRKVIGGVIPVINFNNKKFGLLDTAGSWRIKPQFHDVSDHVGPFVAFRRKRLEFSGIVVANKAGDILWDGPSAT